MKTDLYLGFIDHKRRTRHKTERESEREKRKAHVRRVDPPPLGRRLAFIVDEADLLGHRSCW